MLKIINSLEPFFQDPSRKINVREYARLKGISPPTASRVLAEFTKEKLLIREEFRNFLFFSANFNDKNFQDLKKIYLRGKKK